MKVKVKPGAKDFFKGAKINPGKKYEVIEDMEHYCVISNGYSTFVIDKEDIERTYSLK